MIRFSKDRLQTLFDDFSKKRILVIGDLMLDRYLWGHVSRISPEAPVPVVDIDSESFQLGGAANVIQNVQALHAEVIPIGIIGDDQSGMILKDLFKERGLPIDGLVVDQDRPTTVKTRIIAHSQHVVRTDREVKYGITRKIQYQIIDYIKNHLKDVDIIILQDYNKGLFVSHLITEVIKLALENDKQICVDPKYDHFFDYRGVTVFKPNLKEVIDKLGFCLNSDQALEKAGEKLLDKLQCKAVLITLGESGIALFEKGKPWIKVPTRAVRVHDVSGAGDTVIATLAVARASGASFREAATIANHAAGIVCGEVGIVPVDCERLFQNMYDEIGR